MFRVNLPPGGDVPTKRGEDKLVQKQKYINSPVPDGEGWNVRDEVISDKKAHKDEVVDDVFQVEAEPDQLNISEFQLEVLSDHKELDDLKVNF